MSPNPDPNPDFPPDEPISPDDPIAPDPPDITPPGPEPDPWLPVNLRLVRFTFNSNPVLVNPDYVISVEKGWGATSKITLSTGSKLRVEVVIVDGLPDEVADKLDDKPSIGANAGMVMSSDPMLIDIQRRVMNIERLLRSRLP